MHIQRKTETNIIWMRSDCE